MTREFQNGIKVECGRHAGEHAEKGDCIAPVYMSRIGAAPVTPPASTDTEN